ncbi:MAG: hypothetical protein Ct9H300mP23_10580 [Nitrospinota bacterium]|nr:MAG: hypothetical protein Ct9H300mP23_10580 [Nitrospinota bacterium]
MFFPGIRKCPHEVNLTLNKISNFYPIRPMSRTVLLNPGPVNITDKVRQAMTLPDLCHREKEFSNLMAAIRPNFSKSLI